MSTKHFAHGTLSASDVETINAARRVLLNTAEILCSTGNMPEGVPAYQVLNAGRVTEAAEGAKDALFNFLNSARSYIDCDISDETLIRYGRPEKE